MEVKRPGRRASVSLGVALALLLAGAGSGTHSIADTTESFTVELAPSSDTWVSVPVHRPPVFEGDVTEVSGQTITFAALPDDDFAASHAVTIASGEFAGVRGRIVASGENNVTVHPGIDLSGVAAGDSVRIIPGWTLASFFPDDFPSGIQVLRFESRERGVNVAASSVYEYDASREEWLDVITLAPANDRVIHETEAFIVRDTRAPGADPETLELVMTGLVSDLVPRVDLGTIEENTPQDSHFGVPFPVTLGESGMGEHLDELLAMPRNDSMIRVALYFYIEGSGWFNEAFAPANDEILAPEKAYIYRKAAPGSEERETLATASILIQTENFADSSLNLAPEGSVFGIVVDTDGTGLRAEEFGQFPAFTPGTEQTFLVDRNGSETGNALVFRGVLPADGYIGGALSVPHAVAGGLASSGDPWGIVWFPGVRAGETPRPWDAYGFLPVQGDFPPPRHTVSFFQASLNDTIKTADYFSTFVATFDDWKETHLSPEERDDPVWSEPRSDPGGHGVPILLRYAFQLDPREPGVAGLPEVITGIPEDKKDEYLMVRYRMYPVAYDIDVRVEASDDLLEWTRLGDELIVDQVQGDPITVDIITVRDSIPLAEDERRFLRVAVELIE